MRMFETALVHLPCSWELNRGRGRSWESRPLYRGQKNRTRKKKQIPGNGGSQELFGPMFPWFCLFSLSFQWEEGQKQSSWELFFFPYFRWFFSFRLYCVFVSPLFQRGFRHAATTPLLCVKMLYRNPKTGLGRRVSQKELASEAYRAIGGVTRNSIANRAIAGH